MASPAVTPPASAANLPTPPSTSDPANFDARGDAFLGALPAFQAAENALKDNVFSNASASYNNAVSTAADAVSVSTNAVLVASYVNALPWATGTYAQGARASSIINGRIYFKKTPSSVSAIDPSTDLTNWSIVSTAEPFEPVTASVTQAIAGGNYSFQNATAQAAATNLLTYSELLSNAAWTKNNLTVTPAAWTAPDGTLTANLLTLTSASDPFVGQSVATAATVCHSVHVFAGGANPSTGAVLRIVTVATVAQDDRVTLDFATGAVSVSGSVLNSGAVYLGSGWWRIWATKSAAAGQTATEMRFLPSQLTTGKTVLVWGAQIEAGTAPSSYISTTSAAVTRLAGVIAPQRLVLPNLPVDNDYVGFSVDNGIANNVVNPNDQQFRGPSGLVSGPMTIDNAAASGGLQFINNAWRFV